uniref:Uncharacterized protein n=1 Tax=Fagus sylvatica TaxID=28930 RepID=A0A2N9FC32_FAGSY
MDRTLAWWCLHLDSAFRTTIACAIVDYTTLYGPASLRKLLTYPAYSYLTTILIVLEATLGDSLSGFWHALYASIQVVILSTISLWVIGPARLNYAVATAFYGNYILAATGVALSAFVVALPKSTPLRSKQIALGQLVIVYVGTVVHGAQSGVVMHPVHVASNTILGALASVLAMLLPYPKLAFHESIGSTGGFGDGGYKVDSNGYGDGAKREKRWVHGGNTKEQKRGGSRDGGTKSSPPP